MEDSYQKSHGSILKNSRKLARKTQEETAEYLEISVETYRNWENSRYKADEKSLLQLEPYFGDYELTNRYMREVSPAWRAKAVAAIASVAMCKSLHEQLSAIMPQLAIVIDVTQNVAQTVFC